MLILLGENPCCAYSGRRKKELLTILASINLSSSSLLLFILSLRDPFWKGCYSLGTWIEWIERSQPCNCMLSLIVLLKWVHVDFVGWKPLLCIFCVLGANCLSILGSLFSSFWLLNSLGELQIQKRLFPNFIKI